MKEIMNKEKIRGRRGNTRKVLFKEEEKFRSEEGEWPLAKQEKEMGGNKARECIRQWGS